jgi:hypothetical protein
MRIDYYTFRAIFYADIGHDVELNTLWKIRMIETYLVEEYTIKAKVYIFPPLDFP